MKQFVTLLISVLILNSCFFYRENGIEMKIKNNSSQSIKSVEFTTSEQIKVIKIDELKPNQSVVKFLSMKKNKTDGTYVLRFIRFNGEKEIRTAGYYTNGGSLDNWIDFIVENDSTRVEFNAPIY